MTRVPSRAKQRGRALVADGGADFVESIVPILETAGYSVEVATTGAEALAKSSREHADALAGRTGAELYAQLVERGRGVPAMLMSGGPEDAEPFDPNALLAAIDSALSRGQTG